jgi:hypothetical protein
MSPCELLILVVLRLSDANDLEDLILCSPHSAVGANGILIDRVPTVVELLQVAVNIS